MHIVGAVLLLLWLMTLYQAGSYFAAWVFGYRVNVVSIGVGPKIYEFVVGFTRFRLALIPLMGYVQIAGMNPFEESDPSDRKLFCNGSLVGRAATMFAGPLGNVVPGLLLLALAAVLGYRVPEGPISIAEAKGLAASVLNSEDRVLRVNGRTIDSLTAIGDALARDPQDELVLSVERRGKARDVHLHVLLSGDGQGTFGISFGREGVYRRHSAKQAPGVALREAGRIVGAIGGQLQLAAIGSKSSNSVHGMFGMWPPKIRVADAMVFSGMIGLYLGIFNLLPIPALNGGRLLFLGYEMFTGRKPNARTEAQMHAIGLAVLLLLMACVTVLDLRGTWGSKQQPNAATTSGTSVAKHLRERVDDFRNGCALSRRWGQWEPTLSI